MVINCLSVTPKIMMHLDDAGWQLPKLFSQQVTCQSVQYNSMLTSLFVFVRRFMFDKFIQVHMKWKVECSLLYVIPIKKSQLERDFLNRPIALAQNVHYTLLDSREYSTESAYGASAWLTELAVSGNCQKAATRSHIIHQETDLGDHLRTRFPVIRLTSVHLLSLVQLASFSGYFSK